MNDLRGKLFLMLIGLPLIVSANLECRKHFICKNTTYFNICVDFGDGNLRALESLIYPCPPGFECDETNINECHRVLPTTTVLPVTTASITEKSTLSSTLVETTTPLIRLTDNNSEREVNTPLSTQRSILEDIRLTNENVTNDSTTSTEAAFHMEVNLTKTNPDNITIIPIQNLNDKSITEPNYRKESVIDVSAKFILNTTNTISNVIIENLTTNNSLNISANILNETANLDVSVNSDNGLNNYLHNPLADLILNTTATTNYRNNLITPNNSQENNKQAMNNINPQTNINTELSNEMQSIVDNTTEVKNYLISDTTTNNNNLTGTDIIIINTDNPVSDILKHLAMEKSTISNDTEAIDLLTSDRKRDTENINSTNNPITNGNFNITGSLYNEKTDNVKIEWTTSSTEIVNSLKIDVPHIAEYSQLNNISIFNNTTPIEYDNKNGSNSQITKGHKNISNEEKNVNINTLNSWVDHSNLTSTTTENQTEIVTDITTTLNTFNSSDAININIEALLTINEPVQIVSPTETAITSNNFTKTDTLEDPAAKRIKNNSSEIATEISKISVKTILIKDTTEVTTGQTESNGHLTTGLSIQTSTRMKNISLDEGTEKKLNKTLDGSLLIPKGQNSTETTMNDLNQTTENAMIAYTKLIHTDNNSIKIDDVLSNYSERPFTNLLSSNVLVNSATVLYTETAETEQPSPTELTTEANIVTEALSEILVKSEVIYNAVVERTNISITVAPKKAIVVNSHDAVTETLPEISVKSEIIFNAGESRINTSHIETTTEAVVTINAVTINYSKTLPVNILKHEHISNSTINIENNTNNFMLSTEYTTTESYVTETPIGEPNINTNNTNNELNVTTEIINNTMNSPTVQITTINENKPIDTTTNPRIENTLMNEVLSPSTENIIPSNDTSTLSRPLSVTVNVSDVNGNYILDTIPENIPTSIAHTEDTLINKNNNTNNVQHISSKSNMNKPTINNRIHNSTESTFTSPNSMVEAAVKDSLHKNNTFESNKDIVKIDTTKQISADNNMSQIRDDHKLSKDVISKTDDEHSVSNNFTEVLPEKSAVIDNVIVETTSEYATTLNLTTEETMLNTEQMKMFTMTSTPAINNNENDSNAIYLVPTSNFDDSQRNIELAPIRSNIKLTTVVIEPTTDGMDKFAHVLTNSAFNTENGINDKVNTSIDQYNVATLTTETVVPELTSIRDPKLNLLNETVPSSTEPINVFNVTNQYESSTTNTYNKDQNIKNKSGIHTAVNIFENIPTIDVITTTESIAGITNTTSETSNTVQKVHALKETNQMTTSVKSSTEGGIVIIEPIDKTNVIINTLVPSTTTMKSVTELNAQVSSNMESTGNTAAEVDSSTTVLKTTLIYLAETTANVYPATEIETAKPTMNNVEIKHNMPLRNQETRVLSQVKFESSTDLNMSPHNIVNNIKSTESTIQPTQITDKAVELEILAKTSPPIIVEESKNVQLNNKNATIKQSEINATMKNNIPISIMAPPISSASERNETQINTYENVITVILNVATNNNTAQQTVTVANNYTNIQEHGQITATDERSTPSSISVLIPEYNHTISERRETVVEMNNNPKSQVYKIDPKILVNETDILITMPSKSVNVEPTEKLINNTKTTDYVNSAVTMIVNSTGNIPIVTKEFINVMYETTYKPEAQFTTKTVVDVNYQPQDQKQRNMDNIIQNDTSINGKIFDNIDDNAKRRSEAEVKINKSPDTSNIGSDKVISATTKENKIKEAGENIPVNIQEGNINVEQFQNTTLVVNKTKTETASENILEKLVIITSVTPISQGKNYEELDTTLNMGKPTMLPQFYCIHRSPGNYADNEDCRIFYVCVDDKPAVLKQCQENTVFSDISSQCTKNLSHCVRNNEFHCPTTGRFSDIMKDNYYYICVQNKQKYFVKYKFQCQDGFHLNKLTVKCELDEDVHTSQKEYEKISEISTVPIISTLTEKQSKKGNTKCREEGKFADPSDCSKYYECTEKNGRLRKKKRRCGTEEVFNSDKQSEEIVSSSSTELTTDNNKKMSEPEKQRFDCGHRDRGRYADTYNCNIFYVCIGKHNPLVRECPENTIFSEINKVCTKNLSHCIRRNQFLCTSEGRFSDILKENSYYVCVRNKEHYLRFHLMCGDGFYLNKSTVQCTRHKENSESTSLSEVIGENISNSNSSENLSVSGDGNVDFICHEEGKFADPKNCRKYYKCSVKHGRIRKKKKKCNRGEVFHRDDKKCVSAESYECDDK